MNKLSPVTEQKAGTIALLKVRLAVVILVALVALVPFIANAHNEGKPPLVGLVLAGGQGTRIWPLSRKRYPKQLLRLPHNQNELIWQSVSRVKAVGEHMGRPAHPLIATSAKNLRQIRDLIGKHVPSSNFIPEQVGHKSGGAVFLGAMLAAKKWGHDTPFFVVTADHFITPQEQITRALVAGIHATRDHQSSIATIGMPGKPNHKKFGHLKPRRDGLLATQYEGLQAITLQKFVEKPTFDVSEQLVERGAVMNSGMLVGSAGTIVEMFAEYEAQTRKVHGFDGTYVGSSSSEQPAWERGPLAKAARHWVHNNEADRRYFLSELRNHFKELPNMPWEHVIGEPAAAQGRVLTIAAPQEMQWVDMGSFEDIADMIASMPSRRVSSGQRNNADIIAPDHIEVNATNAKPAFVYYDGTFENQANNTVVVAVGLEQAKIHRSSSLLKIRDGIPTRGPVVPIDILNGETRQTLWVNAESGKETRPPNDRHTQPNKIFADHPTLLRALETAELIGTPSLKVVEMPGHDGKRIVFVSAGDATPIARRKIQDFLPSELR